MTTGVQIGPLLRQGKLLLMLRVLRVMIGQVLTDGESMRVVVCATRPCLLATVVMRVTVKVVGRGSSLEPEIPWRHHHATAVEHVLLAIEPNAVPCVELVDGLWVEAGADLALVVIWHEYLAGVRHWAQIHRHSRCARPWRAMCIQGLLMLRRQWLLMLIPLVLVLVVVARFLRLMLLKMALCRMATDLLVAKLCHEIAVTRHLRSVGHHLVLVLGFLGARGHVIALLACVVTLLVSLLVRLKLILIIVPHSRERFATPVSDLLSLKLRNEPSMIVVKLGAC